MHSKSKMAICLILCILCAIGSVLGQENPGKKLLTRKQDLQTRLDQMDTQSRALPREIVDGFIMEALRRKIDDLLKQVDNELFAIDYKSAEKTLAQIEQVYMKNYSTVLAQDSAISPDDLKKQSAADRYAAYPTASLPNNLTEIESRALTYNQYDLTFRYFGRLNEMPVNDSQACKDGKSRLNMLWSTTQGLKTSTGYLFAAQDDLYYALDYAKAHSLVWEAFSAGQTYESACQIK